MKLFLFLILSAICTAANAQQQPQDNDRCVIIHRAGPAWDFSVDMTAQKDILNPDNVNDPSTHVGYYLNSGMVALGGPMADSPMNVGDIVGMMISPAGATYTD